VRIQHFFEITPSIYQLLYKFPVGKIVKKQSEGVCFC